LTRGSQSYTRTRSPVATISGFVKSQIKFLVPQHEHETNDKQKHGLKNKILGQKSSPAVSEDLFFLAGIVWHNFIRENKNKNNAVDNGRMVISD
jgi:hypothetical protein